MELILVVDQLTAAVAQLGFLWQKHLPSCGLGMGGPG